MFMMYLIHYVLTNMFQLLLLPSSGWLLLQEYKGKNVVSRVTITPFIHSFHWHVHNVTIPCHSQELLPFFCVTYFFLPPFSTNYLSILPHFILPSISWSTFQSCCFQIHIYNTLLGTIIP